MTSHDFDTTRRAVLGGVVGGLSLPLLAACGAGAPSTPASTAAGGADSKGGTAAGSASLGATSEVPVGGGQVFAQAQVVVTQPHKGEFKAFSAVCTHQGCLVTQVSQGQIRCPCHGSAFSVVDGSVVAGPAPSPLPEERITVRKGRISLA